MLYQPENPAWMVTGSSSLSWYLLMMSSQAPAEGTGSPSMSHEG